MSEPWTSLSATLDRVWQTLSRGVADRRSAARHLVLATVGADGGAEARTVILRAADRTRGTLTIHTDAATAKVAEIAREPRATLLVWDPKARLQIRIRATVTARPGTRSEWTAIPDGAQRVYGGTPPPGTPLAAPDGHDPAPDPARFTVLTACITAIETLHLGADRHARARFERDGDFSGHWIAP